MINLTQLQHIISLAKYKNFGKAAEASNVTQPALSISIRKSEKYFENRLFTRSSKLIELTTQGELAVTMAEKMLEVLKDGKTEIGKINDLERGIVRFGLDSFLSRPLIPPILNKINKTHSDISFHINVNPWFNLIDDLNSGNLDFVIAIYSSKDDFKNKNFKLEEIPIPKPVYFARAGHPITKQSTIVGPDIKKYNWVGNIVSPNYGNWLKDVTESVENLISGQFLAMVNDSMMGIDIVTKTNAISAMSEVDLEPYLNNGEIELLDIEWAIPHPKNTAVIVSMADREFSPAAKLLLSEIKEYVKRWGD